MKVQYQRTQNMQYKSITPWLWTYLCILARSWWSQSVKFHWAKPAAHSGSHLLKSHLYSLPHSVPSPKGKDLHKHHIQTSSIQDTGNPTDRYITKQSNKCVRRSITSGLHCVFKIIWLPRMWSWLLTLENNTLKSALAMNHCPTTNSSTHISKPWIKLSFLSFQKTCNINRLPWGGCGRV